MTIRVLSLMLLLVLFSFAEKVLPITETTQRKDQWCWSGCSTPILNYYGESVSQGVIVEYAYGDSSINQWNWLVGHAAVQYQGKTYYPHGIDEIMTHWNTKNRVYYSALSESQWQSEINAEHPFVIRWGWNAGGGHFVVGIGYLDSGKYEIMDPWFGCGYTVSSYNWVKTAKGGQGQWTHSLTTDRDVPVEKYDVLVAAGSGDGAYSVGETVTIVADEAPVGYIFDRWGGNTGKVIGTFDSVATFTMGKENLVFTAMYKTGEVIDTSDLSENFLFIAGWDALADSYGSTALIDTAALLSDTIVHCSLKTVADNSVDDEWAWSQISVSSDTTYDKVDLVKICYRSEGQLRLILDQEGLSLAGAAYEVTLPASVDDTTLCIPVTRFSQPLNIADSLKKSLNMAQVSGLSLALVKRDEEVGFSISALQLNGYVEKSVSLLQMVTAPVSRRVTISHRELQLHGFEGALSLALYSLNGQLLYNNSLSATERSFVLPAMANRFVLLEVRTPQEVFRQRIRL